MRAGLATLQKVERESVFAQLEKRGAFFAGELASGFKKEGIGIDVAREGSIFWLHLSTGGKTIRNLTQIPKDHAPKFKALFHACANKGVYLAPSGYEVGFLGAAHTEQILSDAAKIIVASAKEANG
jgi:glutamate-1-semialdehyde 2,1-aminomutase